MLVRGAATPNLELGRFTLGLLENSEWVRRRVETVAFVDHVTLQRRVTLDISMQAISDVEAAIPGGLPAAQLADPSLRPIPLTMLKKGLLSDFDLRDAGGTSLPVATRPEDSYLAWCAVAAQLDRSGIVVAPASPVGQHMRAILERFPHPQDHEGDLELASWELPSHWDQASRTLWKDIIDDGDCNRTLRDLTFNFLLVTALEKDNGPHIVKMAYEDVFDIGSIASGQRLVAVDAPAVGWTRSCHMQFQAPDGIKLVDVALVRTGADPAGVASPPRQSEYYRWKVSEASAQTYAGPVERANYLVLLLLGVRIPGFLRAAWLSSAFTVFVLGGAVAYHERIATSNGTQDALAALLLVVPSTLSAYLVRPGEHMLLGRALLRIRLGLMLTAFLAYLAAVVVALDLGSSAILRTVTACVAVAGLVFVALSFVVFRAWNDNRKASQTTGLTQKDAIDTFPK